jgi:4-hydroxythreonine-4-phosphate dehydrogenase
MLGKAGYDFTSHAEMLESLTGGRNVTVMMIGEKLRITRVTGHAPIRQVADLITRERVRAALTLTHDALVNDFGIEEPHIVVCGLNPHAGESGLFGTEDQEIVEPAIEDARKHGMHISGPQPADTLFRRARDGHYDAVVCMYHDQGHVAFRLIEFGVGYNVTLGLPIVRTSPDHGTAYDIAGRGYASEKSLLKAIQAAARMAVRRREERAAEG